MAIFTTTKVTKKSVTVPILKELISIPKRFHLIGLDSYPDKLCIVIEEKKAAAHCPACGTLSRSVHSGYRRSLQDLEIQTKAVHLTLVLHKYYCHKRSCPRKIFASDLSSFCSPYSRFTHRATERIEKTALETSSTKAAYLLSLQGLHLSGSTLLRRLHRVSYQETKKYYHVAIDDFARKKGRRYYSIVIDQLSGKVIDILSDRRGEPLAKWLKENPQLITLTCDRSLSYLSAIREHLPFATQICDRFHLLKNLSEELCKYIRAQKKSKDNEQGKENEFRWPQKSYIYRRLQDSLFHIRNDIGYHSLVDYLSTHTLLREGKSILQISGQLQIKTSRVYFYSRTRKLTDLLREDQKKLFQQLHPIARLMAEKILNPEEIKKKLPKAKTIPIYHLQRLTAPVRGEIQKARKEWEKQKKLSDRQNRIYNREIFQAFFQERQTPAHPWLLSLLIGNPMLRKIRELCIWFRKMMNQDHTAGLIQWIQKARQTTLPWLCKFAESINEEYESVQAAIDMPFSNAIAEGVINKVKNIKKQMYGKASFNLLRTKILMAQFG